MLFKLSWNNMKRSLKDYTVFFLTLMLGVAVFYLFNSIDSQQAMIEVSKSQRKIISLMIDLLSYVSVFVAVILGFLIVYANQFLINRRKKEFGIYMTLGMGKRQISKIILLETVFVGLISLVVGLVVGVFGSQFMSILVAKMFEADMKEFQFVFSKAACIKTCLYFAIMFLAVILFHAFTISRYKLIHLLHADKKNERVTLKNPVLCVIVFLASAAVLGYAYWKVTADVSSMDTADKLLPPVLMGIAGTIFIFWSLSGFVLQIAQKMKKSYFKDTNMFVLRQINNRINTMVVTMSVICLMLFMSITILSSGFALRNMLQKDLDEMTPVDLNLVRTTKTPEDTKMTISETLKENGFDMNRLTDVVEIPIYCTGWTWHDSFGSYYDEAYATYPMLLYETAESFIRVSDYNKIAALYGNEQYQLQDDEYMVLCEFYSMKTMRNQALDAGNTTIVIDGKPYHAKYHACKDGFISLSTTHANTGLILVPDSCPLTEEMMKEHFLAANYNDKTEKEKEKTEELFSSADSVLMQKYIERGWNIVSETKTSIVESSVGMATILTFVAIYLGIVFLIASSAILALKQLTDAADNRHRYTILRKIGCDEKMINRALFRQIGIFFGAPLVLAMIHSVFGIQFSMEVASFMANKQDLLVSSVATAVIIGAIYGIYFLATYSGSKNIIREKVNP